jgi:hypothetical protein
MLGWAWCGFHKKHARTHNAKLVFFIQWDLWVSYCVLVCLGRETSSMHYFSCLSGTGTDSTESGLGHVTLNLYFLHLVCSVGHVEDSSASAV